MRTKASFAGHPVHAALVHFPIAFLVGAACLDLLGAAFAMRELWEVGAFLALAGIGSGVIAAAAGIVDLFFLPDAVRGVRASVVRHAAVAGAALAVFVVAWWLRGGILARPSALALGTELTACLLLGLAGFLGGSLVFVHRLGVK